jgi:hypothetical protein
MTAILDRPDAPEAETASVPAAPKKRGGGPRSPEGRERSRRNSLKHGLCSKVVLPNNLGEAVARRTEEFAAEFQPRSSYEEFQVRDMALASARLDLCAEMSIVDRGRVIQRAHLIWDHDRRMAVEDLGAKLSKDPARVAPALRGRKQGADWLIERWEALGEILENKGGWTDDQRRLAFDLLGVPVALRDGCDLLPPPDDVDGLAEAVAEQIQGLREDREVVLDALDAEERSRALQGMPAEEDAASARLRKYEASCRRAFNAAKAELLRLREATGPAGGEAPDESNSHRPTSEAAAIDPAGRSVADLPEESRPVGARPAVAEAPAVAPAASRPSSQSAIVPPAAPPRNRRERRAAEKRARQAARCSGR